MRSATIQRHLSTLESRRISRATSDATTVTMAPSRARLGAILLVLVHVLTLTLAACSSLPAPRDYLFDDANLRAASSAFCKCTCFGNSTIIDLNGGPATTPVTVEDPDKSQKTVRTCNDCTKRLCLDYHLPICKDAEEEDVFTQCFWRDSAKDQTVVLIFIAATVGLLGWAGLKPWVERWREGVRDRGGYAGLGGHGDH